MAEPAALDPIVEIYKKDLEAILEERRGLEGR